jgi:hydrogenase maturation protease
MKKPVTIIGAGNWLVSVDTVGPCVLELVQNRYGQAVELCNMGSAGLVLLDHLHGQELMIVVDACILGGYPGRIHVLEPNLHHPGGDVSSVHQIGPLETLTIAKHFYPEQMPKRILLILVETAGIDTDTQQAACQQVVAILDREIEAWYVKQMSSLR